MEPHQLLLSTVTRTERQIVQHSVAGGDAAGSMCRTLVVLAVVSLFPGCGAGKDRPETALPTALGFVTRTEVAGPEGAAPVSARPYLLRSLEDSTRWVRFDFFGSEGEARGAGGEAYRLRLRTRGLAPRPTHAVFAEWKLEEASVAPLFERSRADLFTLRAQHLESFHADLLFQSLAEPTRYLILGLYDGESGLHQARAHPRIRTFAQQNPPARFGARDLYGVRNFRIERP